MNTLSTQKEFQDIVTASRPQPQVIFKHSLICPISRAAYNRIEDLLDLPSIHTLIVQDNRALNLIIADMLDIPHESPQVIAIADGLVIYHANHSAINKEILVNLLDEHKK